MTRTSEARTAGTDVPPPCAARRLAMWCYQHGVAGLAMQQATTSQREQICHEAGLSEQFAADDATWRAVGELLAQRVIWDAAHKVTRPPIRACLGCILAGAGAVCHRHGAATCAVCREPLHEVFVIAGHRTHPSCDNHRYEKGPQADEQQMNGDLT